jgi:hypothetical protein
MPYATIDKRFSVRNTPLKYETLLYQIIYKNSVRTAKKTQHFTITKINWLTLWRKIIVVCTENHTIPPHSKKKTKLPIIKAGGTYRYHCAWKELTISYITLRSEYLKNQQFPPACPTQCDVILISMLRDLVSLIWAWIKKENKYVGPHPAFSIFVMSKLFP